MKKDVFQEMIDIRQAAADMRARLFPICPRCDPDFETRLKRENLKEKFQVIYCQKHSLEAIKFITKERKWILNGQIWQPNRS